MDRKSAHEGFALSLQTEALSFAESMTAIADVQYEKLTSILRANASTRFGAEHRFAEIDSINRFRELVPVRSYDEITHYIAAIREGHEKVLTSVPVDRLHLSSGTSAPSKLLPFTRSLAHEFQTGIAPWLWSLYQRFPEIAGGSAYWALTPSGELPSLPISVVPIGFDSEAAYFSPTSQEFLPHIIDLPEHRTSLDSSTFVRSTIAGLARNRELTWISAWSPTYLLTLWEAFVEHIDLVLASVEPPDRCRVEMCIEQQSFEPLWPLLKVVSCWGDAWAAQFTNSVKQLFPSTFIELKGLLATEALVTIPWFEDGESGQCYPLAYRSHFFEFICLDSNDVFLAHELVEGRKYEVIVTTSGGLYRYRLYDIVQCTGFRRSVPILKFQGRSNIVSDICGEKLHEDHVRDVLTACCGRFGRGLKFRFLAPEFNPRRYVLFVEPANSDMASVIQNAARSMLGDLDTGLRQNFHYQYCRRLNQLQSPSLALLGFGEMDRYLEIKASGKRSGVLKISELETTPAWLSRLSSTLLEDTP